METQVAATTAPFGINNDNDNININSNIRRNNDEQEKGQRQRQQQRLDALIQARTVQRQAMEATFAQKRTLLDQEKALRQQMAQLEEELQQIQKTMDQTDHAMQRGNESLFELDDQINDLEENLQNKDPSALSSPLTLNSDEILLDPSASTQHSSGEVLTDPLTQQVQLQLPRKDESTTRDSDIFDPHDCQHVPISSSLSTGTATATVRARPQLVLQPLNRNIVRQRRQSAKMESLTSSSPSSSEDAVVPGASTSISTSDDPMTQAIRQTLHDTFQIQDFREHQFNIIQATLRQQDVFVIMRTGGGKSLLYQLPSVVERPTHKITLVISPLLSLMQDQQDQINQFVHSSTSPASRRYKGLDICVSFHSGLSKTEQTENWRRVRDPGQGVGMILVTPERVTKSNQLKAELQRLCASNRFGRIVIDECHCCCQWGHDFRPDYAKLGVLRRTFPNVPILAVTATASDRVRDDCCRILGLHPNRYHFFRSTANRPNLTYRILRKDGSAQDTVNAIAQFIRTKYAKESGIVYTRTRNEANTVAKQLTELGIPSKAYHSDVSPKQKMQVHQSWMQNRRHQTQVVVATIAFGLGINKPDVRFVVHHSMSKTLEAYYQESGRAGRDGNPADCVLYYSPKDVPKMLGMVHGEQSAALTWTMIKYAQQFGSDALCRAILLQNLGEPHNDSTMEAALKAHHDNVPPRDILSHSQTVLQLLYNLQDDNVTMAMLIKEWRSKQSPYDCVRENPPNKDLSVFECEYIIVSLLVQNLIETDLQYTSYDVVVYLKCATPRTEQFLTSPRASFSIRLPDKVPINDPANTGTEEGGWLSTRKKATSASKRRQSSGSITGKKRVSKTKVTRAKATKVTKVKSKATSKAGKSTSKKRQRKTLREEPEIIDIPDDSSSDQSVDISPTVMDRSLECKPSVKHVVGDDLMEDSDSEYEFNG